MTATTQKHVSDILLTEERKMAQKVIASFAAAFKYYNLYPEGHAFSCSYLDRFKSDLDEFLEQHPLLRLEIGRNTFLYKGEPAMAGSADENNPAYLLSRDRILSLEFTRNIEPADITLLLDILKRHCNPLENSDGDIATTLWQNSFAHIHYEAADIFAMEAIQFDLSMFRAVPGPERSAGQEEGAGGGRPRCGPHGGTGAQQGDGRGQGGVSAGGYATYTGSGGGDAGAPSSIFLLAANRDLAELEPEERRWLDSQVRLEEGRDRSSDVIDILLITLAVETNEVDFAAILEFLEAEFFDAMAREDFPLTLKIAVNVTNISTAIKRKRPWSSSLVNLFFASLSREDHYGDLPWLLEYRQLAADPEKNLALLHTLDTLTPEIIPVLVTLAVQIPRDDLTQRRDLVDRIAAKARDNPQPLCRLVAESGEECNLLLLLAAEQLADDRAAPVYLEMSRHPSPLIRKAGMDGFFRTCCELQAEQILHLLADPEKELRERVLSYLEQLDSRLREEVLSSFLVQESPVADELYIMRCYRLLSGCVSFRSMEFLSRNLLESDLKGMFRPMRQAHRSGAAYVLRTFATPESLAVLRQGAESIWPDVRLICRKVLEL